MTATIEPALLDAVARDVAAAAPSVDTGAPATVHFGALAAAGLLDQGVEDLLEGRPEARDVRASATTIAALAEECLPTAFGLWAHRVVEGYLARAPRTDANVAALAQLRAGDAVGATGMAQALKADAGVGELGIEATPDGDGGWYLDGFVAWISNLVDGAVLVLPASVAGGSGGVDDGLVVWVRYGTQGLGPRHISGLLALDATASGTLKLERVHVPADQVVSTDLRGFVQAVKPSFLVLQSSFAAGLIRRSWHEIEQALDRSDNAVFGAEARELGADVEAFLDRWQGLAADVTGAPVRDFLQLRLDASHLAQRATRLELTLAGGRGYLAANAANRRFREAAFLPVQSPSEGHLRWELSSLA
ncbi:MAG: acyl-CoA dehydrogenase family protein [Propionibacteriaceae bacterium]|nr:acyl-CoA dehydrogenase family protein [Propionibacteriaceae bacterium]